MEKLLNKKGKEPDSAQNETNIFVWKQSLFSLGAKAKK